MEICRETHHGDCKMIGVTNSPFEVVACPWCGFQLTPQNPCKWCANCYTLYVVEKTRRGMVAHFGRGIKKSVAVAFAIALAKSGGTRIGETNGG